MAGTLTVQNLQGPSSGANANKIIVPSGQTLYAPGHVVQFAESSSSTLTSWTLSSTRLAAYGSATSNREYIEATSLTITPKSTSSILYCTASVGWRSFTVSPSQAQGSIITLNDTVAIDIVEYPWYPADDWSSSSNPYFPAEQVIGTFSPNSTSPQVIRLRPFIYWEAGTQSEGSISRTKLCVMEIAQ